MPAISKSWVTIADGAVDPDSPIDAALMTGLRDDLVHLREWVGAAYVAGAVQDHDHDGENSKPIAGEVGTCKPWPGHSLPSASWDWLDGGTLSRTTYAALKALLIKEATVTMTIASPCVVTWTGHGLRTNMPIRFFTTGALPTGITAGTHGGAETGTQYYVKVVNSDTFNIAATPGGANINTSGSQSGTHTGTVAPHGDGDGSTTFHKPDWRGRVPVGRDDMGGSAANRITIGSAGFYGIVPGRAGGSQTHTLSAAQVPALSQQTNTSGATSGVAIQILTGGRVLEADATNINTSGGAAHPIVQPSGVADWIIRII